MFYLLNLSDIGDTIAQALRSLMGNILALLYTLIENLYTVFIYLSRAEILDNDFVKSIYNKIGMILGIVMVFKLVFALIQALIDPDKLTDKQKGFTSIITRAIIAIALLGLTPGIFREAFNLQNMIVSSDNGNNVIYKLIAGKNVRGNFQDMGRVLASDLYFSFFTDDENPILERGILDSIDENISSGVYSDRFEVDNYKNLVERVQDPENEATFYDTVDYLAIKTNNKYVIEFDWFLSLGVAIFVIWMFVTYCIQVGIRVVQLAYLQLIAPVPILSYISEPEGSFKKWTSQCIATYLDLFIRLAIIYFIMTLIGDVLSQFREAGSQIMTSTGLDINENKAMLNIIKIFIIIGLLMFAKKVPELLKDLFPKLGGGTASLGFGFKSPKQLFNDMAGAGLIKGAATLGSGIAIGGIAGMASGLRHGEGTRGKIAGMAGGFFRGAASARTKGNVFGNAKKGMANVRAANARAYERHHDGSTVFGRLAPVYADNQAKKDERELKAYSDYDALLKSIDAESDKDAGVQLANESLQSVLRTGRTKKNITWTDSSTGTSYTFTAGQRISQSDMQYAIRASQDDIKKERKNFVERELNKERTSAGSGNQVVVAATKASEKLRVDGVNEGYQGFGKETMDLSSSETITNIVNRLMDENKKSTKAQTTNMTSRGGDRYEEVERHKANAKYKHKDK